MTQIATVKCLLEDGKAEILVRRQSACGHNCESCAGCGPESAAQVTAVADNDMGACPGDTVRVESESRRVLGMAAVFYLLPFLLMFAGCILTAELLHQEEAVCMAVGLVCMAAGIGVNLLADRRIRAARPVQLRIAEVLKSCSDT